MTTICTCCLEPVKQLSLQTPCGHTFHKNCLHYALSTQYSCPNCRASVPLEWRQRHRVGVTLTIEEYWCLFTQSFTVTEIGPQIPSYYEPPGNQVLPFLSQKNQQIRLQEMRMKFNIPAKYTVSLSDLWRCEVNGRNCKYPEWSMPCWFRPLY